MNKVMPPTADDIRWARWQTLAFAVVTSLGLYGVGFLTLLALGAGR